MAPGEPQAGSEINAALLYIKHPRVKDEITAAANALERQKFASDLVFLIDRARRLALYKTAKRLQDAESELGWELAGVPMPASQDLYCETQGVRR